MSKRVKAKTKDGQELWIIVPNIGVYSFATNKNKVTFLEVFYFFAQTLVRPAKKTLTKSEEEKIFEVKKRALYELNNKVQALKFFANEIYKQEKKLIARTDRKKKIYDYSEYQKYLALCEGYLNTFHSIWDFICEYDKLTGNNFSDSIKNEQWFQIDIDIRNIFHHNQSPLLSVENGKILFTFDRLPRSPRFFNATMKNPSGRYQVELAAKDLGTDMVDYLNKWAKKYIDLMDEKEEISAIAGFYKDGRTKTKKVTLKELKKIAHIT